MDKHKEVQCSSSIVKEISSHPIFSILTTFSLLIILYFPYLLPLLLSPVLISTLLLLTTLLHFGSSIPIPIPIPETNKKVLVNTNVEDPIHVEPDTGMDSVEFEQNMNFCDSLVEWGRRGGPLEVIFEEFEGEEVEEEEEDEDNEEVAPPEHSREYSCAGPQRRLDFMEFYNTDSDANSDSSSSSSENMRFRWEEDEGEGMIEIALEEDNLIELDLSACR